MVTFKSRVSPFARKVSFEHSDFRELLRIKENRMEENQEAPGSFHLTNGMET